MTEAAGSRYERKFLPHGVGAQEVVSWVKLHPACFTQAYPQRRVNNIYLDFPDLKSYSDSVEGLAERTKIRIRWYGAMFGRIADPTLELKIKRGLLGFKKGFKLDPFSLDHTGLSEVIRKRLQTRDLPARVAVELDSVDVSLLNGYTRRYFVSGDHRFRLTIDTDLEYYRLKPHSNTFTWREVDRETTIVELKYGCDDDADAYGITASFPFRLTKSSKYVDGLDSLFR